MLGLVPPAQDILRQGLGIPGRGILRVKFQGFVKTADGIFVRAQAAETNAFVVPGNDIVGVKLQGAS